MRPWWIRLGRYARPELPRLSVVVAMMLGVVAIQVLKPWPLKLAVDHVLLAPKETPGVQWLAALPGASSATGLLAWLAAGTVLLFLAASGMGLVRAYVQARAGKAMIYGLGLDLFDHIQRLTITYHGRQRAGDLLQRVMRDSACVRDLVMGVYLPVMSMVATIVVMFAVMWRLDPDLALVAFLFALPLGLVGRRFYGPMTERKYKESALHGDIMAMAEQTLTSLPVVQAFGRESLEDSRFKQLTERTLRTFLRLTSTQLQFKFVGTAVAAVGTAVVLFVGARHVLEGSLTVGGLLVFLAYLASFYGPLTTLAFLSEGAAYSSAGARRVLEVLDAEEQVREAPGARALEARAPGAGGHVQLEGVTFGYETDRPVLREVTLEVRPGETLGLVGATGSGKSTLVSLIPRFFDPWEGRVLFDGTDVRDVKLSSLRDQVAVVLQEPFLLPLSVAENIAYGRPEARLEELVAAAEAAQADDFIRELPEGYDTVIGERGATLSGGQRQRLAIARALLKDAPVLILDEPTSALDAETEASLLDALDRLMEGRTTFVVAHRLSAIRRADRIAVLEGGCVVEQGSVEELLASRGRYHRLLQLQAGGRQEAMA